MAYTANPLTKVLRETWTEDSFKKAFDLEIQGGLNDMKQGMRRQIVPGQVRFTGDPHILENQMYVVSTTPNSFSERAARQRELMQRLAIAQRKGKPSYRQRQKNGRAGRKK